MLRMTSRDLLSILMDCGYESPAYFHKLFKNTFGMTPRAYRLRGAAWISRSSRVTSRSSE